MALMTYREANEVLWRGVRPAHNGTQLIKRQPCTNQTVMLYTVLAGETLHLCSATGAIEAVAAGIVTMAILDDGGVVQYYIMDEAVLAGQSGVTRSQTFWPPVEMPTDWQIRLISTAVGLQLQGSIFGWIE